MVRLFNIFIRPLFEYGHTATIISSKNYTKKWEIIQIKYLKHILLIPNISNKNTLKYTYQPTIQNRINELIIQWHNKIYLNNNEPMITFINTQVKDYNSFDKHLTPYKAIKLLTQQ